MDFDPFDDLDPGEPYDPFNDIEAGDPLPASGGAGAFARGAAEGLFPTTGALAAGLGAGALATAATGNPWIGVPAGLAVGLGAGEVLNRGQDWLMEKFGLREGEGNFSRAQQLADEVEHPYLKTAGAAVPSALLLKPTGAMLQRGIGAAIGGGVTAADELIREGHVDPAKVGIGAATGFALPTANRAGAAIERVGAGAGYRAQPYLPKGMVRPDPSSPWEPPAPISDDVKMTAADPSWREKLDQDFPEIPPGQGGTERPIIEPSQGEQLDRDFPQIPSGQGGAERPVYEPNYRERLDQEFPRVPDHYQGTDVSGLGLDPRLREWEHNVATAKYELYKAPPETKPFWKQALIHAQDNLAKWQNYGAGKGDVTHDPDARLAPSADTNPFTPADSDKANDLTTTARGVAAEQPRAPRLTNAGNPVGAPMANREAAYTSSLLRNYAKDRTPVAGQSRIDIDSPGSPVAEDIQAALGALTPPRAKARLTDQSAPREGEVIPPRRDPSEAGGIWPDGLGDDQPIVDIGGRKPPLPDEGFADFDISPDAAKGLDNRLSSNRFDARADYGEQEAQKARREAQEAAGSEPYTLDLDPAEYRNTTGQRRLPAPEPEVTGAVTPRPTLSVKARPRTADEMRSSRGAREVVPERVVPAETPMDKYAPVNRQERQAPHKFTPQEETSIAQARDRLEAAAKQSEVSETAGKRATVDFRRIQKEFEDTPDRDKGAAAERLLAALPQAAENQRLEGARQTLKINGKDVQIGTGDAAKRKRGAFNAYTEAVQDMVEAGVPEFPLDPSIANVKAVAEHAEQLYEAAKARFGGKDPTSRKDGYWPQKNPYAPYKMVEAARKVADNPIWANVQKYIETLALRGEVGKAEYSGKSTREVGVEAAEGRPVDLERPQFGEHNGGEYGEAFDKAKQELHDWADDLTPEEWAGLDANQEGNLAQTIRTTSDPSATLRQLKNDLSYEMARPRRFSSLAKDRPTREDTQTNKESPEQELARLMGEQKADDAVEPAARKENSLRDTIAEFWAGDTGEAGFLDVFKIGRDLKALASRLMASTAHTAGVNPQAAAAHVQAAVTKVGNASMEYGKSIMKPGFTRLGMRQSQFKFDLRAEVSAAVADKAALPDQAEFKNMYRAEEDQSPLSGKELSYWTKWIQPRLNAALKDHIEYLNLARTMMIPGWEKLKDPKDNGKGYAGWLPHVRNREVSPEREQDVISQTLSPWASHAQTREYFTLQNVATGDRLMYHLDPKDPDHITILRNGAPQRVKVGSLDMAEIGTDIPLTVKGQKGVWKVDNAKVREIRDNAGKNPDGTPKVDYIENPHVAAIVAHASVRLALERLRLLDRFIWDPKFSNFTTKSRAVAEQNGWIERGWVEHQALPQLKGTWMPEAFDWHLQDFVRRGIQVPDSLSEAKANLDAFAGNTAKIFFFFGGPVHGVNVLDKWFIGRGKDWFTAQGWKGLGKFPEAMRSVVSQDKTQRELAENGMNMLYVHTMVKDAIPEAARKLGVDMTKNAWKWDPLAKQFGISTPQMARNLYKYNSAGLWWFTDVLATQRYLELKGQGLAPADAVKKLQHSADDYVMQATYGGEGKGGRLVQNILSDPSVSWFSAFHQHNFHMLGRMLSTPFKKDATMGERVDAATQTALLGAMLAVVYPALSAGYASLTGNKHSEFERRGVSRVAGLVGDFATGKKGYEDVARNVFTPSSVFDTAVRIPQNKRFDDKHIVNPADMRNWRNIPRAAGQAGEFALQQFVSPYKTLSTAAERQGATPGSVAGKFAESMFGLKAPTPKAVMREAKLPISQMREARQREKNPTGVLESIVNRATKRSYGQ